MCAVALALAPRLAVAADAVEASSAAEISSRAALAFDALRDPAFKVRMRAIAVLGNDRPAGTFAALTGVLADDTHHAVRAAAALTLGRLSDPRGVGPLLQAAALDRDAFVQQEARAALDAIAPDLALPHMIAGFGAEQPSVRRQVLTYLAGRALLPRRAEAVVVRALGDVPEVARAARDIVLAQQNESAQRLLVTAISHREVEVRRAGVELLAEVGGPDATAAVLRVYDREAEADAVRTACRTALRRLRDHLDLDQLLVEAASGALEPRARALKLLGVVGGEPAIQAVRKALRDHDIYVRGNAVMALRELRDVDALPLLEEIANEPTNQRIVHLVHHAIKDLKNPKEEHPRN